MLEDGIDRCGVIGGRRQNGVSAWLVDERGVRVRRNKHRAQREGEKKFHGVKRSP
jgi:hypothetical protein